jgi:hypothetical protein
MTHHRSIRIAVVAALCAAVVGAAGGIATGSAATSKSKSKASSTQNARPAGPPGGLAVHSDEVVLNKAGTAFITATEDSGTVDSLSGDQLAIKEAAKSVTYKTVTLTIPSGAKVLRNGASAKLNDLKSGDRVHVSQSSDGTVVIANDSSHRSAPGGPRNGGGLPPSQRTNQQ